MRTVNWLFGISAALFISGIAFVIAAGRMARTIEPIDAAPVTMAVATTAQIMNGITGPAANVIYNAVGTVVGTDGVKEIAPQNDQEWAVIGNSAAALIESGNLLLLGNRAIDQGDWVKMTRAMMDKGQLALKAARDHDVEGILIAGGDINETCDNCHARYQRQ